MKTQIDPETGCTWAEIGAPCWACEEAMPEHHDGLCDECFECQPTDEEIREMVRREVDSQLKSTVNRCIDERLRQERGEVA
jgi:hypothetical protein